MSQFRSTIKSRRGGKEREREREDGDERREDVRGSGVATLQERVADRDESDRDNLRFFVEWVGWDRSKERGRTKRAVS